MGALKTLLPFFKVAPKGQIIGMLALMVAAGLTEGFGILLLVPLLQSLQEEGAAHPNLLVKLLATIHLPLSTEGLMAVLLLLVLLRTALQYGRERASTRLQHQLVDRMRAKSFALLLGVEWRWLTQQRRSDHANSLLTDINRIGTGFNFALGLLASLATMAAYVVAAFSLSWTVTLLALVTGSVLLALLAGQRRRALNLGQGLGLANKSMQATVQESLAGIKVAKILGRESQLLAQFENATQGLRQQQLAFQADTSLSKALFQFGGALLLVTYLLAGLKLWHLEVAQLLTLVVIFSRLIPLFMAAQQQLHYCLHALPALHDAQRLQHEYQAHAEPQNSPALTPLSLTKTIRLEGVGISYSGTDHALIDISVTLPAYTTTAIIGPSGAGKSTLADLLTGLLTADSGHIYIDDEPLTGQKLQAWRQAVAYVPQDVFLFNDSIRVNLLWGNPHASNEALEQALHLAAAEFVFSLPKGLDTEVGDGGLRLSGGERQRLALARALLKQPALLVLDEATSALDLDNELRVREAIERLHGNLTVVVIGHRLPTLEHADLVLQLDQGRILAQGTWQDIKIRQGST